MTYPPPANPDPFGQPAQDPFASPPPSSPDPYAAPPPAAPDPYAAPAAPDPYGAYGQPPAAPQNPYDPYAQQQSPAPQYGQPAQPYPAAPSPYGQYPGYGAPTADPNKQNGLAIGSMCSGIGSVVLGCCCWPLGFIAAVAAIIMGIVGNKQIGERGGRGKGMALAGIITGAVGILLAIVGLILALTGANQNMFNDLIHNSGSS